LQKIVQPHKVCKTFWVKKQDGYELKRAAKLLSQLKAKKRRHLALCALGNWKKKKSCENQGRGRQRGIGRRKGHI